MATETVVSDHASTTDEKFVKIEKDEALAEKIASLANEDGVEQDKPEDAQDQATPSSNTEGDEVKAELAAAEIEKPDDSPVLEASAEDINLKQDNVEDVQIPEAPFSKTEEESDKKLEPEVTVDSTDDSVPLESNVAVADTLEEEKELIIDSQTGSITEPVHVAADEPQSTEPAEKETPQEQEKEPVETDEEKQLETAKILEAPAETLEESSDVAENNPQKEPEVVEEAKIVETGVQEEVKTEPEPVATEKTEPEPESEEISQVAEEPSTIAIPEPQEAEQPSTVAIPEPSAEADEKLGETIEEKNNGRDIGRNRQQGCRACRNCERRACD